MAVSVDEAKDLICELCRNFYTQGWVSGTGGGISMKAEGDKIVMAPSGVQKERMEPDDMFVLDAAGNVLHMPVARPPPYKPPKLSECAPLFTAVRGSPQAALQHAATAFGSTCHFGTQLNAAAPSLQGAQPAQPVLKTKLLQRQPPAAAKPQLLLTLLLSPCPAGV
jgi:hypothetical protein